LKLNNKKNQRRLQRKFIQLQKENYPKKTRTSTQTQLQIQIQIQTEASTKANYSNKSLWLSRIK